MGDPTAMDSNPYESPRENRRSGAPAAGYDASPRRHPALGCLLIFLWIFVLFFGFTGFFARIDSGEDFFESIVLDVLVGVAIVGIAILSSHRVLPPPPLWRRMVPAVFIALLVSGLLIGWHCFQVHVRQRAFDLRQEQFQTTDVPE